MGRDLLTDLRQGKQLGAGEQLLLTLRLSIPGMLAQLSSVIMHYIDASMVESLGAGASASIGLASTTTWLFNGLSSAVVVGFSIQAAHAIGAGEVKKARNLAKQSYVLAISFSVIMAVIGCLISGGLPVWLGGGADIRADASRYLLIYCCSLPILESINLAGSMLQASGNMRTPSLCLALMCILDVFFNAVLIFPPTTYGWISLPGAGLGVAGAALGTLAAMAVAAAVLNWVLWRKSPILHLRRDEILAFQPVQLRKAFRLSMPVAAERIVMSSAQILLTGIIAPLGTVAIAAHSFAITVESLCYMPGYGVGNAASTLIGQSIGAGRRDLTYRLGCLTVGLGMATMTLTGVLMYLLAPQMMSLLSPDSRVVELGAAVLRMEAFCEPFFAAAIVSFSVFCAAGDTLRPTILNFASMWAVRIPLAAIAVRLYGLPGVWFAMCTELFVRGMLFLIRLVRKRWLPKCYPEMTQGEEKPL
ncbi:MAG: MATE family efflux transporter [Clostridiales bacterium]|nr:MATE family efflux transporter [Clostridiales bacterium]